MPRWRAAVDVKTEQDSFHKEALVDAPNLEGLIDMAEDPFDVALADLEERVAAEDVTLLQLTVERVAV